MCNSLFGSIFPFDTDNNEYSIIRNKFVGSYICYIDKNEYIHYCYIKDVRFAEKKDSIILLCDGFCKTDNTYHWSLNFSIEKRIESIDNITVISKYDYDNVVKDYINDISFNFYTSK